ncbi:aryl-alcohol dehydrogenase-like predicted oxidoreductase [Asanoa ferruginea]|uniref:Aryl-alcohol dehydrogenase-like predicted oxidoreductase n=1 Tax=Asanoa ferruginea TaxID=53367 RepID=A0A3D9ZLU9_9ACTN|nr:aldo/keto reductase [Asanoa ferruginea]REF98255.1 aryl-alcohol dehydrogenase-like predicted oxidoreductase [Asanoa ferruginea]GIF50554.1 oxidoreductase [Asanoa ferruginea]
MTLRQHPIGTQGLVAGVEGLGTFGMTAAYGTRDDAEAVATVHRALELGVTMFDTADMYGAGGAEELLGRALAERRDEAVIATKVGGVTLDQAGKIIGPANGHPDYLRAAVDRSLHRLGTDHIDLLYLHRVDPAVPVEESFGALGELVAEGKVRYLGISEAAPASIRTAHNTAPLSAVQTEYSLFTRDVEANGVLAGVHELGIGFVAYSPLGRGFLTGAVRDLADLPADDYRQTWPRLAGDNLDRNLHIVDRISDIAKRENLSPAQLALAWVLAQGVTAIPGTKRRGYLAENVGAAEIELSTVVRDELSEAAPVGAAVGARYTPVAMAAIEE